MKQLLMSIQLTWTANAAAAIVSPPTAAGALYGIGGPFWDRAPEKTPWPYCVYRQKPSLKNMFGFGAGLYEEFVGIEFQVFASDASTGGLLLAAGYADAIAGVFDTKANYTALSTEKLKMVRRVPSPMMKQETNYNAPGITVYSGTLIYEYAVERGSG